MMKIFHPLIGMALAFSPAIVFADSLNFDTPLSGWYTDRYDPGVFQINNTQFLGNNVLQEGIRGVDLQLNSFYNYQGKAHDLTMLSDPVQSYSIDLYVDSAWGAQDISAGFWGVAVDQSLPVLDPNYITAYPILAYRQGSDATSGAGIYYWDTNLGTWNFGTAVSSGWNNLKYVINVGTGIDYYVNNTLVGSIGDTVTSSDKSIILNSKNYGQDYDVYYDNFLSAGAPAVPTPTAAYAGLALLPLVFGLKRLKRRD